MCVSKMMSLAAVFLVGSHAMRVRKTASVVTELSDVDAADEVNEGGDSAKVGLPVLQFDGNPIGLGTIPEAHGLFVKIFGGRRGLSIDDLRTLSIERKFPQSYQYPGTLESRRSPPRAKTTFATRIQRGGIPDDVDATTFVEARLRNTNLIICPFLSTMVNMGALPVKQSYPNEELLRATVTAGLDFVTAEEHVAGNFANNPTAAEDLFNLEGVTNEHVTSTGINDCATSFRRCRRGEPGFRRCRRITIDRSCSVPNLSIFEQFVTVVDENRNGFITEEELTKAGDAADELEDVQIYPDAFALESLEVFDFDALVERFEALD